MLSPARPLREGVETSNTEATKATTRETEATTRATTRPTTQPTTRPVTTQAPSTVPTTTPTTLAEVLDYCSDGIRNFGEEDVDCGGNCSPCPPPGIVGRVVQYTGRGIYALPIFLILALGYILKRRGYNLH
jgi:hypothetical protein